MRKPAQPLPKWIEKLLPSGIQRYTIDIGGNDVSVMEVGTGRPVLCVHGNPTWGFLYRKVAERLRGAPFRLIMPDLLGLGFSSRVSAEQHTLSNHARWLATTIDALSLKNLILVGQDWGGPIGLLGAFDSGARVDGMVIMNTSVGPPKEDFRPTLFHRASRWPAVSDLLFRGIGFPQNTLASVQGDKLSIRGPVARAYRYPLRNRLHNQAPLALARMVPNNLSHPSVDELRRCEKLFTDFDGPIELVWGTRDPILGRLIRRLERLRPDAAVTRTEAGHFLQEEVPGDIAKAIIRVARSSEAAYDPPS